jgi:hypothetical protein
VPIVSQLASDGNLIAGGLTAAIAQIMQIPNLATGPGSVLATLQGYLTTIQNDAASIAAATATPAASVVSEIVTFIGKFAPLAIGLLPGGSAIATAVLPIINAAISLTPGLLVAIGLTGGPATAIQGPYTPAVARSILAAAH